MVIFSVHPIPKHFGEKLKVDRLRARGLSIEIWDFSPLFWDQTALHGYAKGRDDFMFSDLKIRVFHDRDAVISALESLSNEVLFGLSGFFKFGDDDFIFEAAAKAKLPIILQHFDPVPIPEFGLDRLLYHLKFLRRKWLVRKRQPDAVITSGTAGVLQTELMFPNADIVNVPSLLVDWDYVAAGKGDTAEPSRDRYILFVDDAIAGHTDSALLGQEICDDVEGYYTRLRRFFDFIEEELALPVVVSASKKHIYEDPVSLFGPREIVYGKTLEMMGDARLAIGHYSSSFYQSLAVGTPIIRLSDPSLKGFFRRGIKLGRRMYGTKEMSISEVTPNAIKQAIQDQDSRPNTIVTQQLHAQGVGTSYVDQMLEIIPRLQQRRSDRRTCNECKS